MNPQTSRCPIHSGSAPNVPGGVSADYSQNATPTKERIFRCPFDAQGLKDGTTLVAKLSENRIERFRQLADAYEQFFSKPKIPGINLVLPDSVQGTFSSLEDVKKRILCYQAEMLGAQIAFRLQSIHDLIRQRVSLRDLSLADQHRAFCYLTLFEITKSLMDESGWEVDVLTRWVFQVVTDFLAQGFANPEVKIPYPQSEDIMMEIGPGGVIISAERDKKIFQPEENQNTFSVVKTPFYPVTFPRYSTQVEIWVTRESDFIGVGREARHAIRHAANAVLAQDGVLLEDGISSVQNGGVWIPEYPIE